MSRRCACETFLIANAAKPHQSEAAPVTLHRIEQIRQDIAIWPDERLLLAVTDEARRRRFSAANWNCQLISLDDLAVWPRMGGLPDAATRGSAVDAARYVKDKGIPPGATRLGALVKAARGDPVGIEQVCRALPLITIERALFSDPSFHRTSWILDDGSHRAVTLALISSNPEVKVLAGTRRKGLELQ